MAQSAPTEVPTVISGVNYAGDTVLHIIASFGDSKHVQLVDEICSKAVNLLTVPNRLGDTPLHCTARAGHIEMVELLINQNKKRCISAAMAGTGMVFVEQHEKFLGARNERGQTALHEAVRCGHKLIVLKLFCEDYRLATLASEQGAVVRCRLACIVDEDGVSPLYLATMLDRIDIVRILTTKQEGDNGPPPSYAGPDGKTALHAAVFQSEELTRLILEWNEDLIRVADNSRNYAVSLSRDRAVELFLRKFQSCNYVADKEGFLPINVAARERSLRVVKLLLDAYPDCEWMRDARGRNFVHIAVHYGASLVVQFACQACSAVTLNMKDNEGNTPLHLAVKGGNERIFCLLMQNKEVCLDFMNRKGRTPLELAFINEEPGIGFHQIRCSSDIISFLCLEKIQNPKYWITASLYIAGAQSNSRLDQLIESLPVADKEVESKRMDKLTPVLFVTSALITVIAFVAAFTLLGGYSAEDYANGGVPTLAGQYAFKAFVFSGTFAAISSMLAIINFIDLGLDLLPKQPRVYYFLVAVTFMRIALMCMLVAFASTVYMVLAPVAKMSAIFVCAMTFILVGSGAFPLVQMFIHANALQARMGSLAWLRRLKRTYYQSFVVGHVLLVIGILFTGCLFFLLAYL